MGKFWVTFHVGTDSVTYIEVLELAKSPDLLPEVRGEIESQLQERYGAGTAPRIISIERL
jgi:hypothetical protein